MEKFDWRQPIQTNIGLLRIAGLWPKGSSSFKLNLYAIYGTVLNSFFVFGFNLTQTLSIFLMHNDLQTVVTTTLSSLTLSISILKLYYLVVNMPILKNLMTQINSDIFQAKNSRQVRLVESSVSFWRTVRNVFFLVVSMASCFWIIFPMFEPNERRLPFTAWFPFNSKISPNFEIVYLYQSASLCFINVVNVDIDILIAALNMFVGAQCDMLCDDLRHIHQFENIGEKLKDCVRHHKAVIRFAKDSNAFFNWIVLVQFFTSAVSLGTTLFELTLVPTFSSYSLTYVLYGNAVLIQIFLYCWFGNEVELRSKNISYAIFETDWPNAPLRVQKEIILVMLRAASPIRVSAFNLFYLSLDTFTAILRTSWSYFAVLHTLNGNA